MKEKNKIIIGILLMLVLIMTIAYAYLLQKVKITGTTAIGSTWNIRITNIREKKKSVGASSKEEPTYGATTATFNAGFTSPGDYITYEIEISNLGTLDAIVNDINLIGEETSSIKYTISGIKKGNLVSGNSKKYLEVNIQYNSHIRTQPSTISSSMALMISFVEAFGNEEVNDESNTEILGKEYMIGDMVEFNNANWYVIKDSQYSDNYVTLMKEKVLTHDELGNYGATHICTEHDVSNPEHGCKTVGQIIVADTMPFYINQECHGKTYNGQTYNWYSESGCSNNYETSTIKKFFEEEYINVLGPNNLREIDGYKIRLITEAELKQDLGCVYNDCKSPHRWLYRDYGEKKDRLNNVIGGYWTMTSYPYYNDNKNVIVMGPGGMIYSNGVVYSDEIGVRPVINLLKTSIE